MGGVDQPGNRRSIRDQGFELPTSSGCASGFLSLAFRSSINSLTFRMECYRSHSVRALMNGGLEASLPARRFKPLTR